MKSFLSNLAVLGGSLGLVAIMLLLLGASPVEAAQVIWTHVFGSAEGIAYALFYATPLIFTGLAVAVGFRAGLFNIGAEGQLYVAAFATAWMGMQVAALPWLLALSLVMLAGGLAGGVWGGAAGVLRAYRGAHEVIVTIMLNFVAIGLTTYWATHTFREPGQAIPQTPKLGESLQLSRASDWTTWLAQRANEWGFGSVAESLTSGWFEIRPHVPLNTMFFVALAMCGLVWWMFRHSVWGFSLDAVGRNARAASAAGLPVQRTIAGAMVLSGVLAAGAGLNEVLGQSHRFTYAFSDGLGFLGIAVALLGRNRPFGVLFAALFFGVLVRGGLFLDLFVDRIDKDVIFVVQGILIWAVGLAGTVKVGLARGWGSTTAHA